MALTPEQLIQIAQAKYQRPKSQIGELSDIINQGISNYYQAKNQRLDIHRKMIEQEMLEEKRAADQKTAAENAAIRQRFLQTGNQGTPADPKERLEGVYEEPEVTINSDGTTKFSYKPKSTTPPKMEPQTYYDEKKKAKRIGKRDAAGNIIMDPNDPLADAPESAKPGMGLTPAQKKVDQMFGAEYTRYVGAGGYADTMAQIQSLDDAAKRLASGKENLTGPLMTMQPDWSRKRLNPASMDVQQQVESSVQRTLKQTLGGQFAMREGEMFMQRGYDPALPEEMNAKKVARMINQLKTMALAKQNAVDYYEEHGTMQGYVGKLYTLKDGVMVETSKDDFYKMMEPTAEGEDVDVPGGDDGIGWSDDEEQELRALESELGGRR